MCNDNNLAEKLPIKDTNLPQALTPGYNPCRKFFPAYSPLFDTWTRADYVTSLSNAAHTCGISMGEFKECMHTLVWYNPDIFNSLQLSIWHASTTDPVHRVAADYSDAALHAQWRDTWMTYQSRDCKTRTRIMGVASQEAMLDNERLANLHAEHWLRTLNEALSKLHVARGSQQMSRALFTDPHKVGFYLAKWFVMESYHKRDEGIINATRSVSRIYSKMQRHVRQLENAMSESNYDGYIDLKNAQTTLNEVQHEIESMGNVKTKPCGCPHCQCQDPDYVTATKSAEKLKEQIAMFKELGGHRNTERYTELWNALQSQLNKVKDIVYAVNSKSEVEFLMTDDYHVVGKHMVCFIHLDLVRMSNRKKK